MRYLLIALMAVSLNAFADKKIDKKDFSVLGKIDEETYKKVEESKQVAPEAIGDQKNSKTKVVMSCKDSVGREFKKDEAGYENCLMNMKHQYDTNKANPKKKNQKDGNSANFNFKIGE